MRQRGHRDVNDLSNAQTTWELSNAFKPQAGSHNAHHWVVQEGQSPHRGAFLLSWDSPKQEECVTFSFPLTVYREASFPVFTFLFCQQSICILKVKPSHKWLSPLFLPAHPSLWVCSNPWLLLAGMERTPLISLISFYNQINQTKRAGFHFGPPLTSQPYIFTHTHTHKQVCTCIGAPTPPRG